MRPALQRLLSRPSTFDLLRYLTAVDAPLLSLKIACCHGSRQARRRNTGLAVLASTLEDEVEEYSSRDEPQFDSHSTATSGGPNTLPAQNFVRRVGAKDTSASVKSIAHGVDTKSFKGSWKDFRWTFEELDFQSDLEATDSNGRRYLSKPKYRNDMNLWTFLLDFRQRVYGIEGVRPFWKAVQQNKIRLPVEGPAATALWKAFLELGYHDPKVLQEIWQYANKLLKETGKRWTLLYVRIVEHFLLNRKGNLAVKWHRRLLEHHAPGPKGFAEMCRQVALWNGEMLQLRTIYQENHHRNAYAKIVPVLCQREKFKLALSWHSFLVNLGDLPNTSKATEGLLKYLLKYDLTTALEIKKKLVQLKVPIDASLASSISGVPLLTSEMVNIIHGKTFNIPVQKYNDKLGARFFATTWISLDSAIAGVSALGVQEIGPLSLHAIALRENEASCVYQRIKQLNGLGISTGKSVFARAVTDFSRTRQQDLLDSLLKSDQHPDALEDFLLQEKLLVSYAQAHDWVQYKRTLAIRLIISKNPDWEVPNIQMRNLARIGDMNGVRAILQQMQQPPIQVHPVTVATLTKAVLSRCEKSLGPSQTTKPTKDLDILISTLQDILYNGGPVCVYHWREIIRRLGMLGHTEQVFRLCLFLAKWYSPLRKDDPMKFSIDRGHRIGHDLPPVSTKHPSHPLSQLFPSSLQQSIVEWGFVKALGRKPGAHLRDESGLKIVAWLLPERASSGRHHSTDVTSGIKFLRRLQHYGVQIHVQSVRSAILNRLIIYYGHGHSARRHNRIAKYYNPLSFAQMVRQIDLAMGGRAFPRVKNIKRMVLSSSLARTQRLRRKRERYTRKYPTREHVDY